MNPIRPFVPVLSTFGLFLLLIWAVVSCADWEEVAKQKGRHIARLQDDSTRTHGLNALLRKQATDAVTFAERYKSSRDSLVRVADSQTSKLTYAEQVEGYLRGLIANKTLPTPKPGRIVAVSDADVVRASLNTVNRERIERETADSLRYSIGVRDAQNLSLRLDHLAKNEAIGKAQNHARRRLRKVAKGLLRKLVNGPQIKFLNQQIDSLQQAKETGENQRKIDGRP